MITVDCAVYLINPVIVELPTLQDRLVPSIYQFEDRKDYLRRKVTASNCKIQNDCSRSLIRRVQDRSNYNKPTNISKK